MTKKRYKRINIYYIGYNTIKKIDDCENIYSVNPLYLRINHASEYIEEKNENKNKIKTINGRKENDYGKDYMKTKFNSDDDLP